MMYDGWMWGMSWGWIPILVILGLGLWLAVRATRSAGPVRGSSPAGDDAERILRDRFARGEIGNDEYRARLQSLHRS